MGSGERVAGGGWRVAGGGTEGLSVYGFSVKPLAAVLHDDGMEAGAPDDAALDGYRGLRAWQVAMDLVVESYRVVKLLPGDERFELARQITCAAVSVPANIAEGYGRLRRGEYLNHLSIARGSLKELETLLTIAERLGYVTAGELASSAELCDHVSRMLTRLTRSLRA